MIHILGKASIILDLVKLGMGSRIEEEFRRLIAMPDGIILVTGPTGMLGGLIKKGTTNEGNKIPLLGDIPLLGWAFKYGKKSTAKTELLVMITPSLIESDDVLEQYIKKFQEKMQGLRQGLGGRHGQLPGKRWRISGRRIAEGLRRTVQVRG